MIHTRRLRCLTGEAWIKSKLPAVKSPLTVRPTQGLSSLEKYENYTLQGKARKRGKMSKQSGKTASDVEVIQKSEEDSLHIHTTPIRMRMREVYEITPHEAQLSAVSAHQREMYKGVDVREPSTVSKYDGTRPKSLSMQDKVQAVADFMSGNLAFQVMSPEWVKLFNLQHLELDVIYFLWVLHLHLIARRALSVSVDDWSRRREVMQEMLESMRTSWEQSCQSLMGRPPMFKIRHFILDMYYVVSCNLEEALSHEGPGADLAVLSVLMRLMPLPRPEDLSFYTYYALVHYIRFHIALLDRTPDEEIYKGNFHFLSPLDPVITRPYEEVPMDDVIRRWSAENCASSASSENNDRKKS